ncbi:MAG: cytochrome c, partial [Chitinophagaceae bacterium]|nr:cytochrome c [Chitinophagaceae bacterium]
MKQASIIATAFLIVFAVGCGGKHKDPKSVYMPDMAYSRAIETYSPLDTLKAQGIFYNATPVKGTIKRGELFPFSIEKDKDADSTNYSLSRQVTNPLPMPQGPQMKEAERLYLVNCGICHGTALDGNGPLYKDGTGPYAAAPRNLVADPLVTNMPDGQMFYSITYGKGQMGSYASQLSTTQRWMIVH